MSRSRRNGTAQEELGREFTTGRAGFRAVKDPTDKERWFSINRKPIRMVQGTVREVATGNTPPHAATKERPEHEIAVSHPVEPVKSTAQKWLMNGTFS